MPRIRLPTAGLEISKHATGTFSCQRTLHTIHPLTPREPQTKPEGQAIKPRPPKPHQLPQRPVLDESTITEKFLHGSGPGGQKINKTSSAVQLTHLPSGTVLKCQATRSRTQNRKIARRLLAEKLEVVEKGEESRTALKAQIVERKKASGKKKSKRKYRALAAEGS